MQEPLKHDDMEIYKKVNGRLTNEVTEKYNEDEKSAPVVKSEKRPREKVIVALEKEPAYIRNQIKNHIRSHYDDGEQKPVNLFTPLKSSPDEAFKDTAKTLDLNKMLIDMKEDMYLHMYDKLLKEKPNEKVLGVIRKYAPEIKAAAEEFGVNPTALAGAVYSEHALNVNWKDMLDVPAALLLNKDTSIGLGQVELSTADDLEKNKYIESLGDGWQGRNKRIAALADPKENMRYAAARLKQIEDLWKDTYPEISERLDILNTLYNINPTGSRGVNANPRPNDFGANAHNASDEIEKALEIY